MPACEIRQAGNIITTFMEAYMNKWQRITLGIMALLIFALQFLMGDKFQRDFISGVLVMLFLASIIMTLLKRRANS